MASAEISEYHDGCLSLCAKFRLLCQVHCTVYSCVKAELQLYSRMGICGNNTKTKSYSHIQIGDQFFYLLYHLSLSPLPSLSFTRLLLSLFLSFAFFLSFFDPLPSAIPKNCSPVIYHPQLPGSQTLPSN